MLVSVVIPLFDEERLVGRAVRSVLEQTHRDLELVVVNDGSTDGSVHEVERVADARTRIVQQRNAGHCAARNTGIASARGEWVALLDADDFYEPGFLAAIASAAHALPAADVLFTNSRRLRPDGTSRLAVEDGPREPQILEDYFRFALDHGGYPMNCSSVAIRRATFARSGLFTPGYERGGDIELWSRLACTATVAYVPEVLATYDLRAGGRLTRTLELPAEPVCAQTIELWLAQGRVPERLRESASAFALRRRQEYHLLHLKRRASRA